MIAATLKALTWGTVATAVLSALLLAIDGDGDGLLRTERSALTATHRAGVAPAAAPSPARSSRSTAPVRPNSSAQRH